MKSEKLLKSESDAVSPVVGVMLMLVVTIIIAAVVSGFAGGIMTSSDKTPQATIKGTFSLSDGMRITHTGGDPIAMHKVVFGIYDGETFGPDVDTVTKQTLNKSTMTYYNADGKVEDVMGPSGSYNMTSFVAGSSIYIGERYCAPDYLQPGICPDGYDYDNDKSQYHNDKYKNRWSLCLYNVNNIGRDFVLTVSDTSGNLIAKTKVTVTS
ncbi:FlaG/FlaF family flagellin (archaellin) [Methanomicrobium sp. W14]|uniref:type IV pilin N-terminal domain-containing protein n=1 Tax=Methanomicrobium sp. W14 TaxID=2817839 RepID=UPI001FDA07CF|nr:type IV pilin N-terminal domain-containing protein [Methanomicrobium sp. W14]MBP2134402.1 FlaG/FlaF family flagellin (archaellin) [Methanomicrobium sp. W14]